MDRAARTTAEHACSHRRHERHERRDNGICHRARCYISILSLSTPAHYVPRYTYTVWDRPALAALCRENALEWMITFLVAAHALAPLFGNEYEDFQASKLGNGSASIARLDRVLERQLRSRFQRLAKTGIIHSPALGVGARLGAEVRALNTVVSLGIGVDFNPGPKSRWVLYGDARALHFNDASFGTVYTNILDHIPQPSRFFDEAYRVLSRNGTLIIDVSYNVPDEWSVATWQEQAAHISQQLLRPRWDLITKEEVKEANDNPTLPRGKGKMCHYIVKRGR